MKTDVFLLAHSTEIDQGNPAGVMENSWNFEIFGNFWKSHREWINGGQIGIWIAKFQHP